MDYYDVVIIGAGPAGLNCLYHLQNSGKRILLLEKNKEIGPKVCAGGLSYGCLQYLNLPGRYLEREFKEIIIRTPNQKRIVRSHQPIIATIDRKKLANWQLESLTNSNIKIKTGILITEIKDNYVVVDGTKYYYGFLVGADGPNSTIKKYLQLSPDCSGLAFQYIISTDKYISLELYYDISRFNAWPIWVFPHRNYVSIGCGTDPKIFSVSKLKNYFIDWLVDNKIDFSKGEFQSFTINSNYQGYKFGNIYLVGEAAGLASYFTGEGIYQALISGEVVAKEIICQNDNCNNLIRIIKKNEKHIKTARAIIKLKYLKNLFIDFILFLMRSKFIARKILDFCFR